jgi:hypothetical protein
LDLQVVLLIFIIAMLHIAVSVLTFVLSHVRIGWWWAPWADYNEQ